MFIQSRNNPALAAESHRISGIMQRFEPVLTTSYKNASPNQVYNIGFGNMYKLKNGHKLGVVLNGSVLPAHRRHLHRPRAINTVFSRAL